MMKESIVSVCCRFNMNRVLADYLDKFYAPSLAAARELAQDGYESLKQAVRTGRDLRNRWDAITVTGFATSVDAHEVVTEGQQVEVTCTVSLGGLSPLEVEVELFYLIEGENEHRTIPMYPQSDASSPGVYTCTFEIAGRGRLSMNARLLPAAPILQDLYPNLIKWAE